MSYQNEEPWRLYYWPGFPGRGEFVRLIFEEAQVPYVDVGNQGGVAEVLKFIKGENEGTQVNAPPIVQRGDVTLFQSTNICFYLARKYGLCPTDENEAFQANQLALTVADVVSECHDTHHPVATSLYYEDQKAEALKRAKEFRQVRIPKYLGFFERVLKKNEKSKHEYLVGDKLSYVDLSVTHLLIGLEYAFPNGMKKVEGNFPLLMQLKERVLKRPNIDAYMKSSRRQKFSNGIFRQYPELDVD